MKHTTKSEFGYTKPSGSFLMMLKLHKNIDASWFKWEDFKKKEKKNGGMQSDIYNCS
jgi:hypothetical protein